MCSDGSLTLCKGESGGKLDLTFVLDPTQTMRPSLSLSPARHKSSTLEGLALSGAVALTSKRSNEKGLTLWSTAQNLEKARQEVLDSHSLQAELDFILQALRHPASLFNTWSASQRW